MALPCPGSARPQHSTGLNNSTCFPQGLRLPCTPLPSIPYSLPTGQGPESPRRCTVAPPSLPLQPGSPVQGRSNASLPADSRGGTLMAGTLESTSANLFVFAEEQTENQRGQVVCPRSNSRAETNNPGQSSLFGVPAIASKAAGLGLVRRSCGPLDTQTPGRKQEADQQSGPTRSNSQRSLHMGCHTVCPP